MNLDITDSMGQGKLVRHMQNLSYTYDEFLICIGPGPSISSVMCKNLLYSGPSYPSSHVFQLTQLHGKVLMTLNININIFFCSIFGNSALNFVETGPLLKVV